MVYQLGEYLRQLRGKRSLREIADMSNNDLSHNYIGTAEKGIGTNGHPFTPSPEKTTSFCKSL